MEIIKSVLEMQERSRELRKSGKRIGVVPTMGYLHDGHLSLLRIARRKCDLLVLTSFVNPTQFGPNEDLEAYPRDFDRDTRLAEAEHTDIIFAPEYKDMYPFGLSAIVEVLKMEDLLCGEFRPGHFRGVATIVAKLFNCIRPHVAVFGQKDAQQAAIIKRITSDLFFDVEIIVAPTVREPDGLAMSSRNIYLKVDERQEALALSKSLFLAQELIGAGERSARNIREKMSNLIRQFPKVGVEYIAVVHPDTLEPVPEITNSALIAIAARVGRARLIDNVIVQA